MAPPPRYHCRGAVVGTCRTVGGWCTCSTERSSMVWGASFRGVEIGGRRSRHADALRPRRVSASVSTPADFPVAGRGLGSGAIDTAEGMYGQSSHVAPQNPSTQ